MTTVRERLEKAIREQRVASIVYGDDGASRLTEPHAIAQSADGSLCCLSWQVAGFSASGVQEGWKMLRLDKVRSVALHQERFPVRPGYVAPTMKGGLLATVPIRKGERK